MEESDIKIGVRVADKLSDDENGQEIDFSTGIIISGPTKDPLNGELKVYVKWDNNYPPEEVFISKIDLESVVIAQAQKLEEEFKAYEDSIIAKLEEAAKLIDEANALAQQAKLENLSEMYDATYPLHNAIDRAGWSSSSLSC